jgi:hypothetical protein
VEDTTKRDIKGRFVKGQHYNRETEFGKTNIGHYIDGRTLNKRCKDCGIKIDYKATRCMPCLSKIKRGKPLSEQTTAKLRILGEARRNPEGHKIRHAAGYILEKASSHKFADHEGYVREHRLVYERHFNCCLLEYTVIHHRNGKKDDNRIQNLEPMYNSLHVSEHTRKDMSGRVCSTCGSNKTRWYRRKFVISYGWYKDGRDGFICKKCYECSRQPIV